MDWNDETIARLRAFWADGHSTAEIGRRLGVSKNAVVGKAHRLNLPPRPSPIRRDAAPGARPRNAQPRRITGPTLPSLAAEAPVAPVALPPGPTRLRAGPVDIDPVPPLASMRSDEMAASIPKPPAMRVVAPRSTRVAACCWPLGEPGTKSFRFCDAEAANGKPYCQSHAQLAYVKVRDRREDAA
jgi:GcrA cell cycle regulator